jgi:hypothetical protein
LRRLCLLTMLLISGVTGTSTAEAIQESQYEKAKRIVYTVFPRATAPAALRIVGCETGYTYSERSYNSSGATGYFQILTGNHGRYFTYAGKGFRLNAKRLLDPWYNTRAAYFMSAGGYDWHEWSCRP